jgi:Carboxylesterase family
LTVLRRPPLNAPTAEDAALKWIQQHIDKFGGDKGKVIMYVATPYLALFEIF